MKLMGAVLLSGRLRFSDIPPPPIREKQVLVKVLAAGLTPADVAAIRGTMPYSYGKIVGSAGLVRVLELGLGAGKFVVGENAIVSPRCFTSLALVNNGVMAEQASIDSECLEPAPQSLTGIFGLYVSLVVHIPQTISSFSGSSLLISGCNYEGYVVARLARDMMKVESLCSSEQGLRRIARLGVRTYLGGNLERDYDIVYISSLDPYINSLATRRCLDSLYISPNVPEFYVPLGRGLKKVVTASDMRLDIARALNLVREVHSELRDMYRVVESLKAVVEASTHTNYVAYISQYTQYATHIDKNIEI